MSRKVVIGIFTLLIVVVAAIWLDPTRTVLGRLQGESFFQNRPTSYWGQVLEAGPAERSAAVDSLEKGGSASVAVLTELVGATPGSGWQSAEVRWTAVEILGKLGPDAQAAGDAVVSALSDSDSHMQAVAAATVPMIDVPAEQAVPKLIPLLDGPHCVVAARALSKYKSKAAVALPPLLKILKDKERPSEERWNATRTLGKIGPPAVEVVPDLIAGLKDEDPLVREHCAEAFGDIGPTADEGVPHLIAALSDEAVKVRRDSVRSLGQIGKSSLPAVPEMKKLLDDPEEIVRDAAKTAIQLIAPDELPAELPEKPPEKEADSDKTEAAATPK